MTEPVEMDVFQSIMIISLQRLYDVQIAMLAQMNPNKAKELANLHRAGRTLAPDFRAVEDDLEVQ